MGSFWVSIWVPMCSDGQRMPKALLTELQLAQQLQGFRHVPSTASCTDHGHDIHRLRKSWPSWPWLGRAQSHLVNCRKKKILADSWIHVDSWHYDYITLFSVMSLQWLENEPQTSGFLDSSQASEPPVISPSVIVSHEALGWGQMFDIPCPKWSFNFATV